MATVEPPPGALTAIAQEVPDDVPIVLVNLLRYRDETTVNGEDLTGREAYERYAKALEPLIITVGGRPIWRGQARFLLIGPPEEHWDEIILVAYPRRSSFERMVRDPRFEAHTALRTAALVDSRLIVATAPQSIGRIAWSIHKLIARFR